MAGAKSLQSDGRANNTNLCSDATTRRYTYWHSVRWIDIWWMSCSKHYSRNVCHFWRSMHAESRIHHLLANNAIRFCRFGFVKKMSKQKYRPERSCPAFHAAYWLYGFYANSSSRSSNGGFCWFRLFWLNSGNQLTQFICSHWNHQRTILTNKQWHCHH